MANENVLPPYSVLMSVYSGDEPACFIEAVESIAAQSWPPKEIILVEDGPLPQLLREAESRCAKEYPGLIRVVVLPENKGLAEAMRAGLEECTCEWIARMDADDVSDPLRCEKELRAAQENHADIVGCDCEEFSDRISQPVARRLFPADHDSLVAFSKRRTPFCHPAVMMKKSAVEKAGNYQNVYLLEDYDLFVRMLAGGAVGCTLKEILYHVRVSKAFYSRRGGVRYVATLIRFNWKLLKMGWTTPSDFFLRSCGNIVVGLAPASLRAWMYRRLLRK